MFHSSHPILGRSVLRPGPSDLCLKISVKSLQDSLKYVYEARDSVKKHVECPGSQSD